MINSKSSEPEDRLSELPDSLIFLIFGFLPLEEVVRTTILSNRWKNLWTSIPCLTFNYGLLDDSFTLPCLTLDDCGIDSTDRFRNFVNGALKFWRGIRILKFKFDLCLEHQKSLFSDIDSWLHFATENEVEELYLQFPYPYDHMGNRDYIYSEEAYWVPQFLYSCSSLKVLLIESCYFEIHDSVQWNQLKSLTIGHFCYGVTEKMINQILCGSPHLEVFNLTLTESKQALNIQSSSLKKLSISKCSFYYNEVPWTDTEIRIWTPNLKTLEISGVPYGKCLLMDVSSLTHATLGHLYPLVYHEDSWFWNYFLGERLRQIFRTIQHVEKVTLSQWCTKVVAAMIKKDPLPRLSDVNFLELNICCSAEYKQILDCLEIFPQVKMLVLTSEPYIYTPTCTDYNISESCLKFETNIPNSFLLQLRTVEVTLTKGENSALPFIEYLLKHASQLEKMVFRKRRGYKKYDVEVFFLGITASVDEILRQMQIYLNC